MKEKHYLLKVLGLSGFPRIFSFLFTLLSFPIMLRRVGAAEYGILVYVSSIIAIFECFADFGISNAAGKQIAIARLNRPSLLKKEIYSWVFFQLKASLIGLIPMILATFYLVYTSKYSNINYLIIVFSIAATWITIIINFIRSVLTAILSFKSLAVLDTCESVTRSSSYLVVAFYMPNVKGLVIALFLTAIIISTTAFVTLIVTLKKLKLNNNFEDKNELGFKLELKLMIKESLNFLWLRLATRCFIGLPIYIIGNQFNASVVGVIATIQRMVDLLTFPFAVIGNALGVRAKELLNVGENAINSVWEVITRVQSLAIIQWAFTFVGTEIFSTFLFKGQKPEPIIFGILTLTILTTANSTLVNPLTDFIGALSKRNILLTMFSVIQLPIIWLGGHYFGVIGSISGYVLILILINIGYYYISMIAFFPKKTYKLKLEVKMFVSISIILAFLVVLLQHSILLHEVLKISKFKLNLYSIGFYSIVLLLILFFIKKLRAYYLTKYFFEFDSVNSTN
jgi:O-antigen/teichoic acid export membrane protein